MLHTGQIAQRLLGLWFINNAQARMWYWKADVFLMYVDVVVSNI